jgi:hypothetical protein
VVLVGVAVHGALDGRATSALAAAGLALWMTGLFAALPAVFVFGHSMRPRQVSHLRSWITGALTMPYFGARRAQD